MKQTATITDLPERKPGESEKDYSRRLADWVRGEDVRTKTDLRGWTGCPPFHLDKLP
jgi:hypothetical protein